jgi:hypothetical protein
MAGTDEKAAVVAKYRATPRFKQALQIIAPDSSRQAECESDLVGALRLIEAGAKIDKSGLTPAKRGKLFQELTKTLQRAIDLATRARYEEYTPRRTPWDSRIDDLKCFLQETKLAADYVSKFEVSKGAPRRSNTRIAAVWQAHILLEKYGKRPPGFSREGPWLKLARVLLGNQQADLFDYMQTRHKLNQSLVG